MAETPAIAPAAEDCTSPAEKLYAALRVHGVDILTASGRLDEQYMTDGKTSPLLLRDIERAVAGLTAALAEFKAGTASPAGTETV